MMREVTLNNGFKIPDFGLGTYMSLEEETIQHAIDIGYRLIDTASIYKNEHVIGKAIKSSPIPREQFFIVTKLWRDNLGYHSTKIEFEKSLKNLGVDYIDLYLIHWPANQKNFKNWQQTNADTWRAMEELQNEGKIKSIGVSNFFQKHLEALFQTTNIIPAVNQIEFHPGYWQKHLVEFCETHGIVVQSWSPLARGKIFNIPELVSLSKKHNRSIPQICLRWILQHNVIPLPKSGTINRLIENKSILDFRLSNQEMKIIDQIQQVGFSGELPDIWPDRIESSL